MNFSDMTPDERIQAALHFIQESQNQMALACQALCSVEVPESFSTPKLHDSIKKHWHRVNNRRTALNRTKLMEVLS